MDIKTTSNSPYMYTNEGTPEMDILSAASIGDLGMVSQILQKGFEVDQRNESGWTALMYAANFGHYNVIKLLIDHGSSVNAQEWIQGRSPLMLAASCGHTRCLEVLIALGGADVDMVDFQGRNAAYYAIHSGHGRNKIIAKLLRIQPKPRSISRSRPMATVSRSINPDIVISSENEIVSNTSYQPSTRWASGLSTSPYSKSSKTTELTSFYSPLQSIGNRDNSTSYANEIPSTPSPTNQLYKSLTTPHGGIHSASSFSSSSYHQNHCCTFTPNSIGSDMRKRRLAMQSGGDRFSNIPSKASRGYDIVSAMDKTSNHDCGYDQSYHHHQLAESQLTMINAIAANVVGAVSKTASPNGVSPKKVENGQDTSDDSAQVSNGERSSDGDIGDPQSDQKSDQSLQPPPSSSSTSNGCTQSPISSNTSQSSDTGISGSNESSQIISSPSNCNNASGSGDGKTSSPITLDCTSNSRSPLPENLDDLLERIGLSQYSSIFATHGIDLYVFLTLEDSDLVSLGITIHGHRRKMHLAQLRFRESVEITSSQERFLADWLLSEREYLKKENHELRKRIQTLTAMAQ